MSEYVLGIDLGTSTTAAALVIDGIPQTIPITGEDTDIMPSVVSFLDGGRTIVVGGEAKKKLPQNPENTVYSVKRLVGRKFSNPDTKKYAKMFPYRIVEGPNDSVVLQIHDRQYSPQDISAMILSKIKAAAEAFVGCEIQKAVITVPANYNEPQRRVTQNAGKMAGLDVIRIINEPTAAALAYGFGNRFDEKIVVYDFGGGTFDITILEVRDNFFEVLSTEGDSFLGGDDIDNALVDYFIVDIEATHNIKLECTNTVRTILISEAERIKKELSVVESINLTIRNLIPMQSGAMLDYTIRIDRGLFEQIISPIVDRSFDCSARALENAHLKPEQIDAIVLVGGTTKIPYIQRKVSEFFGKDPFLGIETELVIAMGAAILGHSLIEEQSKETPVLLDVVPMSLGVGTAGDFIELLIEKNEPLPLERTSVFTNASDNQTAVRIGIYQGDKTKQSESHLMGEIVLNDLRKARRGELKIQVTFEVDTNGVLNVKAMDLETGNRQNIELNILGLG